MHKFSRHRPATARAVLAALGLSGVLAAPAHAGPLEVVHAFRGGADGAWPHGGLVVDPAGVIYGTTLYGGSEADAGTLFRLKDGGFSLLHTFSGRSDGEAPQGDLVVSRDGALYGTTFRGGERDGGTIFRFTSEIGYERLVNLGAGGVQGIGNGPVAGLTERADGALFYGTTMYGGGPRCGCGTLFSFDPATREVRTLFSFRGSDGANPQAPVAIVAGSPPGMPVLVGTTGYGITSNNGLHGRGALFRFDSAGLTLESTATRGGKQPQAGLTRTADGGYWGANSSGGSLGGGNVFRVGADGLARTVHSFGTSLAGEGSAPTSTLLLASDGMLYGTTTFGGADGCAYCGTVFRIDPRTGRHETLHSFDGSDGSWPNGKLAEGPGGWLYGIAQRSGAHDQGTVYRLRM